VFLHNIVGTLFFVELIIGFKQCIRQIEN